MLQTETTNILHWFKINSMVANSAKFQIMFFGIRKLRQVDFKIRTISLKSKTSLR